MTNRHVKLSKNKLNLLTNFISLFLFTICAITGILKFPAITNLLHLYDLFTYKAITTVHDLSGLLLVIFILIHIMLHGYYFKKIFRLRN